MGLWQRVTTGKECCVNLTGFHIGSDLSKHILLKVLGCGLEGLSTNSQLSTEREE